MQNETVQETGSSRCWQLFWPCLWWAAVQAATGSALGSGEERKSLNLIADGYYLSGKTATHTELP